MNYKDIDFTFENAEKYPDAPIYRDDIDVSVAKWFLSKDCSTVFVPLGTKDRFCKWAFESFARTWKLRIPVEYEKRKLYYDKNNGVGDSGYSIHIDESGNPVGEPFKTEP